MKSFNILLPVSDHISKDLAMGNNLHNTLVATQYVQKVFIL